MKNDSEQNSDTYYTHTRARAHTHTCLVRAWKGAFFCKAIASNTFTVETFRPCCMPKSLRGCPWLLANHFLVMHFGPNAQPWPRPEATNAWCGMLHLPQKREAVRLPQKTPD